MELLVATLNDGKLREIRKELAIPGLELLSPADVGGFELPEETGDTFEANALLKARALTGAFGKAAIADDSGLVVDALGGRPGIHSSRYAGPECDPEKNMDLLLREMRGMNGEDRRARFVCIVAVTAPMREPFFARGECEGRILEARRGAGGFGYDPVFLPDGHERSMAELSLDEKNAISHRGRALRAIRPMVERMMTPSA
jgi:XTP/dITP diphosphohydrolase